MLDNLILVLEQARTTARVTKRYAWSHGFELGLFDAELSTAVLGQQH